MSLPGAGPGPSAEERPRASARPQPPPAHLGAAPLPPWTPAAALGVPHPFPRDQETPAGQAVSGLSSVWRMAGSPVSPHAGAEPSLPHMPQVRGPRVRGKDHGLLSPGQRVLSRPDHPPSGAQGREGRAAAPTGGHLDPRGLQFSPEAARPLPQWQTRSCPLSLWTLVWGLWRPGRKGASIFARNHTAFARAPFMHAEEAGRVPSSPPGRSGALWESPLSVEVPSMQNTEN